MRTFTRTGSEPRGSNTHPASSFRLTSSTTPVTGAGDLLRATRAASLPFTGSVDPCRATRATLFSRLPRARARTLL